ncbi:MAG TPA: lysylphosphatidylglycerol synthase transmembrane domain-containing protein [Blastocatellia bacterium]|nr:lysylphosphatidylglycerol synthase transmembrane domain-containing protein [Blastocatellia bacterium]
MSHFLKRQLKIITGFVVGAAFIIWFASRLNWSAVWSDLLSADLKLIIVATLLISLTYLIRSFRWQALLAPMKKTTISHLFAANAIGFAAIFLFGRAGEFVRPVIASMRERIKFTVTLATILIERVFDSITVVVFFSLGLLFFNYDIADPDSRRIIHDLLPVAYFFIAVCVTGIILLVFLSRKEHTPSPAIKGTGFKKWFKSHLSHLLYNLITGLRVLRDRKALILTVSQTLLLWACVGLATYLVLRALNVRLTTTQVVFVLGFEMVGSTIPTPGGAAGAFHTAAAAGLRLLGVETNLAASCAIILHLVTFAPSVIFGGFYVIRDGVSISALRNLGEDLSEHPEQLRLNADKEPSIP